MHREDCLTSLTFSSTALEKAAGAKWGAPRLVSMLIRCDGVGTYAAVRLQSADGIELESAALFELKILAYKTDRI